MATQLRRLKHDGVHADLPMVQEALTAEIAGVSACKILQVIAAWPDHAGPFC
ncbi:hypothetical protein [Bradyrhizobium sp. CCBAU 25338]|uniref:hypothetical protein n=1 Tax=Bradyrhizobium sp. CCBAU 25338 TaxID=1641877 RepID=UPI002302F0F2|nr:hypothetical protein [Bradyrhizobium sp. CCBAU 25338]